MARSATAYLGRGYACETGNILHRLEKPGPPQAEIPSGPPTPGPVATPLMYPKLRVDPPKQFRIQPSPITFVL